MKRIGKIIIYVCAGLFILGMIGAIFSNSDSKDSSGTVSASSDNAPTPPAAKQWVEVYRFKGNGEKKSAPFYLQGNSARLKYSYAQDNEYAALFNAYVVEKGHDLMKQGGIPEVMIQESEKSESYITKDAGDYYLVVNGLGKWEVVVEEER